jgi:hypothetical protein
MFMVRPWVSGRPRFITFTSTRVRDTSQDCVMARATAKASPG